MSYKVQVIAPDGRIILQETIGASGEDDYDQWNLFEATLDDFQSPLAKLGESVIDAVFEDIEEHE